MTLCKVCDGAPGRIWTNWLGEVAASPGDVEGISGDVLSLVNAHLDCKEQSLCEQPECAGCMRDRREGDRRGAGSRYDGGGGDDDEWCMRALKLSFSGTGRVPHAHLPTIEYHDMRVFFISSHAFATIHYAVIGLHSMLHARIWPTRDKVDLGERDKCVRECGLPLSYAHV